MQKDKKIKSKTKKAPTKNQFGSSEKISDCECNSTSSDEDCCKAKKSKRSKVKRRESSSSTYSSSSSSTESSSSSSSSSSTTSSSDDNRKRKKKNTAILKRKLKEKREEKRNSRRRMAAEKKKKAKLLEGRDVNKEKLVPKVLKRKSKSVNNKLEQPEEASNDIPIELMERSKAMAPMRKEEWEKKQNVVKRIYDEETKRHRLIKGDGEVIEEIVSKERHREINKQATKGDGEYFSSKVTQYSTK